MSLLALLAGLLAQYAYPIRGRQPLMAFYGRMCLSIAKRLNAGDSGTQIVYWRLLMALGRNAEAVSVARKATELDPVLSFSAAIASMIICTTSPSQIKSPITQS